MTANNKNRDEKIKGQERPFGLGHEFWRKLYSIFVTEKEKQNKQNFYENFMFETLRSKRMKVKFFKTIILFESMYLLLVKKESAYEKKHVFWYRNNVKIV